MKQAWNRYGWIVSTLIGSFLFALGFDLFLAPNDLNPGGISGLSQVAVELLGFGSVGTLSVLLNLPLFLMGGLKIGKQFFTGSVIGLLFSSAMIDLMAGIGLHDMEPLICALYGGVVCGLGLGIVFMAGTSTGGSDILARLLKLRYRNVPIGQITMSFDAIVVALTGLVFRDVSKALYTGVTVFLIGQIVDAVIYRFDYSRVVLIITKEHDEIARQIGMKLDRGATFLHGEGSFSGAPTKVVLTAVKRQQVAELKDLVNSIDPGAFLVVQEAHQVLGEGFSRYSRESL